MKESFGWGLELEYPLASLDGRLLFIDDFDWRQLNSLLNEAFPPAGDGFAAKYPGHNGGHCYLEGFDVFSEDRREMLELKVKGVEMRTSVYPTLAGALAEALSLFGRLSDALLPIGVRPVVFGGHPTGQPFRGEQSGRSHDDWKAAEVTMITAGLHVNVSLPAELERSCSIEEATARADYYGPAMCLFSLNSPYLYGKPWLLPGGVCGKSSRSFLRSFYRHVLTAKPGSYGTRFHFSLFDMVPSLATLGGFAELCMGILLADEKRAPVARTVRSYNIAEVAKYGYDAQLFDGNELSTTAATLAARALETAAAGLTRYGLGFRYLTLLGEMLEQRRLFSDEMLAALQAHGPEGARLPGFTGFADADAIAGPST